MDSMHLQTGSTGGAEAVLGLQPTSSISVAYDSQFGLGSYNDLMLLEVDEKLLPDILNQRVSLRGQPDEDAVLCTASKTYAIKFVGSSNSVFLIPPMDQLSELCDNQGDNNMAIASTVRLAPGCMELVEIAPKLDKLRFLLNQNPYNFAEASEMDIPEERERTKMGLYRWGDLVERLQASDMELELALQSLSAIEIDGYWRMLSEEYLNGILNMLLHNIILNDWSIDALSEDEVVGMLETDGFPRNIAKHFLQVFSSEVDAGVDIKSHVRKLDTQRVCMQLARGILKDGKMKIDIFMDKWLRKVPDGMNASFNILEGEVLTEKIGMETWVYSFRVSSLPSTPAERFTVLFKERSKWEWKDLQPFVRDLKVPGLSSEALLLKYTRRSQPSSDAEPIFSPR